MNNKFDLSIYKHRLNEGLFDDDLISNDNSHDILSHALSIESQVKELNMRLYEAKMFGELNHSETARKIFFNHINHFKYENNTVIFEAECIYFRLNSLKLFNELIDILLSYDFKVLYRFLYIYFGGYEISKYNTNNSYIPIKINFNNFDKCIEKCNSIGIYGAELNNLYGLPNSNLLSFNDCIINTLDGIYNKVRVLTFNYKLKLPSVKDWSSLPTNLLLQLEVCYYNAWYITTEHLLHFNNFPEDAINIPRLLFVPHYSMNVLRPLRNYIKNIFFEDNPDMEKKLRKDLMNKIREPYDKLF